MENKKLHITARVTHHQNPFWSIQYYFEGEYIGFAASCGNLIHFTDSVYHFCLKHGIQPPKKQIEKFKNQSK